MRLATRVRHGAKHLDSLMPGWARKVRLRDLNLKRGMYAGKGDCGCILAQLDANETTGEWSRGARSILGVHFADQSVKDEGFTLNAVETQGFREARLNWAELTDLWKDEIRARR